MNRVRKVGEFLARTDIFFYTLIWLMFLTVIGTIAQRNIGLYQAQMTYFSAWYFWFGYIPLPGAYPTMGIVFVGLSSKLLFKTQWTYARTGTIISHFGGLLLLFGGFLTANFSIEGNMAIVEGETSSFVGDYHNVELAIVETTTSNKKDKVFAFSRGWLSEEEDISHSELPITLKIQKFCENCRIRRKVVMKNVESQKSNLRFKGFAKRFELLTAKSEISAEQNRAGILYKVSGAEVEDNATYISYQYMDHNVEIKSGERTFRVILRKEQRKIPFEIELLDFEQISHPGTGMARSYKSIINLRDNGVVEKRVIQMNEPLRYKGYTFYQSSFVNGEGPMSAQTSVFSVVKNMGRLFPYISSLIMCFGLLIHLAIQTPKLIRRKES